MDFPKILKQNQIPCENIAYTNEFGTLILNDIIQLYPELELI